MKKILFFTAAISFVIGLHAQQAQVREFTPLPTKKQPAKKMVVEPIKSATMLNTDVQKIEQKPHKATEANYTYKSTISNAQ